MKIFRSSGGYAQSDGKKQSSKKSVIFRSRYHVGQKLHGKLLKWESQNLGWIEVQDLTLLASIQATPPIGTLLTFKVEQMYPEIILKELHSGAEDEESVPGKTPQETAGDFISARAKFESRCLYLFARKYSPQKPAFVQFTEFLKSDHDYIDTFLEVLTCVKGLNQFSKNLSLIYMPWLIPNALNHEAVITINTRKNPAGSFYEGMFSFTHPKIGATCLKIMYKKPSAGFKIISSQKINSEQLTSLNINKNINFLGNENMPKGTSGGVLLNFFN